MPKFKNRLFDPNSATSEVSVYTWAIVLANVYQRTKFEECVSYTVVDLLPSTKEEVNAFARVCLSVCLSACLLARLFENACMDLNEMLRVDRCRDMDELINFSARSGL